MSLPKNVREYIPANPKPRNRRSEPRRVLVLVEDLGGHFPTGERFGAKIFFPIGGEPTLYVRRLRVSHVEVCGDLARVGSLIFRAAPLMAFIEQHGATVTVTSDEPASDPCAMRPAHLI